MNTNLIGGGGDTRGPISKNFPGPIFFPNPALLSDKHRPLQYVPWAARMKISNWEIKLLNVLGMLIAACIESMWNTFSVRLSRSGEGATEAITLALHSVPHALNFMTVSTST